MPTGYSIVSYGQMVECEPRMEAYAKALKQAIVPGCTVIDIGAGFGIFSLLACQFGAGQVVAIEPDDSSELIMPLAKLNGFAERVTVVREISTKFEPTAKADIIISDLRGSLPFFENHIEAIVDARKRLLKPGGVLLPQRDEMRVALVNAPRQYRDCNHPWKRNRYGLDLRSARKFATNQTSKVFLGPRSLISEAKTLETIEYHSRISPNFDATVELRAQFDRISHGILLWFDAEISEGLGYSNAPGHPPLVYGQTFLPFEEPVRLTKGDVVVARVSANLVDGGYIWSWHVCFPSPAGDAEGRQFKHSTFHTRILSPQKMARRSTSYVPAVCERQALDRECLTLIDGRRSNAQIAEIMQKNNPSSFPDAKAALDYVISLALRYQ